MAAANIILTNFTAGELSPRLYGRPDLQKYSNAAKELYNFTVLPHGGAARRGGTRYVANVKNNSAYAMLVSFTFSTTQAYMLEFGANYIRFFKDQGSIYDIQSTVTGITNANPAVVTTAAAHSLINGNRVVLTSVSGMHQINNREFIVANKTATTFQLASTDSTAYGVYTSGGVTDRIYEVFSVYSATDLAGLRFAQSADTLFIVHHDWPMYKLLRSGHAAWTLTLATIEEGPFLDMNTDMANTMSLNVASGVGILTATNLLTFEAGHLGALWRIWEEANGASFGYAHWAPGATVTVSNGSYWEYEGNVYNVVSGGGAAMGSTAAYPRHTEGTADVWYGGGTARMRYEHSGFVVVRIDSLIDTRNANITVLKNRTPITAYGGRSSAQWQEGAWSDKRGYPRAITFHEQRLLLAGSGFQPQTVWGSVSGIYTKFKDGALDDDSYAYTIAADSVDVIRQLSSGKTLAMFTVGSEYVMQAGNPTEPITPTNIKIGRETTYGSAPLKPIRVGPAVLFGQRAGIDTNGARKLRELVYNFQTDSYVAPDLTILSEHITEGGLIEGAYQATPDAIVWYVRGDGYLVGLTYERDQQVVAWHKHQFGGVDAEAKHVSGIPGIDADEIWIIVERMINGETVRTIEWMQPGLLDDDAKEDGIFLDCSLSYSGSPADMITGLWHLNGETVYALVDGAVAANLTVTDGAITLPFEGSKIHIGFNYTSRLATLRPEAGASAGTAQGRTKRIHETILRLHRTLGGHVGPNAERMDEISYRSVSDPMDASPPLFSGDKVIPFDGGYEREGYTVVKQDQPLPMTVLAIISSLKTAG